MSDFGEKVKRKRARAPKVRSGCKTWCEKDKRTCDGYIAPPETKPKTKSLALHRKQYDLMSRRLATVSKLLVPAALSPETFGSTLELDVCHHFRTYTVSELASSLNAMSFWHAYALPLSQTSKPVKAAIGALGGAHKAFKLQTQTDSLTQSLAQSYEIASIQHYNNAIQVMQEYMNSPDKDFQVILTCCLMFICTESLYGRYKNVTRHLEAAFSLLNACDRWDLAKFMENIGPSLCGLASDLFFYVGDNHSTKLVAEITEWADKQDPIDLEVPGEPFTSAQAAAAALTHVETLCDVELYAECPDCSDGKLCGDDGVSCARRDKELVSEAFYHHWSERYQAFKKTFDPSKASASELFRFKVLECEETTWQATFKLNHIDDDLETADCIEILKKAEEIIKMTQSDKGQIFTFQANLVPPISYVIISCQDTSVQWEAITDTATTLPNDLVQRLQADYLAAGSIDQALEETTCFSD
ncbi:transcription factor FSS1 [Fusarium denticulatum]|uniref:Transcription factor FSS1 n=1 Tax=Fusarium denticulatum TaxID=48507 RepID=A0A8H5U647_9HYPO|nr:transcription factor FSS1 [Fusarium denticulatum]